MELSPQDLLNQIVDRKTKHDALQKKYSDEMMSLQTHIEVQGHEQAVLQGQLASLQDRMRIQEQMARDEEK
eukprot:12887009-Prorocentrum_lima.AAC.1